MGYWIKKDCLTFSLFLAVFSRFLAVFRTLNKKSIKAIVDIIFCGIACILCFKRSIHFFCVVRPLRHLFVRFLFLAGFLSFFFCHVRLVRVACFFRSRWSTYISPVGLQPDAKWHLSNDAKIRTHMRPWLPTRLVQSPRSCPNTFTQTRQDTWH